MLKLLECNVALKVWHMFNLILVCSLLFNSGQGMKRKHVANHSNERILHPKRLGTARERF